jgi:hypothetical protein
VPALSSLLRPDPVTYTAQLGAESVTVTFDAAKMTGRWEREIAEAAKTGDDATVSDLILSIFIGWDVTDDAGQPMPISKELLLDLPGKALANLIEGMRTAANPASEEGNASGSTSSIPATGSISLPASPPNGQPTLSSPTPSASPSPT